jgi:hypothetical protein
MTAVDHAAEFLRCLINLNVEGIRKLWAHVQPNLPQPKNDSEALIALHMARTSSTRLPVRYRAYSHAWLIERGLPSQLPDHLKPKAERLYPVVRDAVGISVNTTSAMFEPMIVPVRTAMENAVLDAYAEGRKDPAFVKARMKEAQERETKKLLGVKLGG